MTNELCKSHSLPFHPACALNGLPPPDMQAQSQSQSEVSFLRNIAFMRAQGSYNSVARYPNSISLPWLPARARLAGSGLPVI